MNFKVLVAVAAALGKPAHACPWRTGRGRHLTLARTFTAIIIATSFGIAGTAQAAGDAAAGKTKAAMCTSCHGEKGEGVAPNPKLAGKSEAEQVKALKDFKSGSRANPIMKGMAATLSDADMENLAAYYSSFK
jgi:cytochrome c553